MRLFLSILFLFFSLHSKAATITELFGDGVFGTQWGDSFETVLAKYPKAKKKNISDIVWLELKDTRKVFEIDRDRQRLHFSFDSEMRLIGVGVTFDTESYITLTNKLTTMFGDFEKPNMASATLIWKDKKTYINLALIPSTFGMETMLSVGYVGLDKPESDKKSLGFN
ncbi:hypothetical protein SAMN04487870_2244 [Pseudoalteromonas sp. DSM 26666]|jgi:hypothetical protein|uniref:hypothetical protein n=1 Tax=unclassified Pseudoalteromonas TaxID=194690 RepID=UPI0008EFA89D|nr:MULTISPECIES: hypothetical protein [unclassified Pseudoalteromonas]MDN3406086.1 hypothetical protein [Pseudoalteromonas sp. APC 3218]SFT89059.1 hypothetical protein SAMN04487870_2244 [Pseudoalteromonas sp. DSM 26666]